MGVSLKQVGQRILEALIPRGGFMDKISSNPDLYGKSPPLFFKKNDKPVHLQTTRQSRSILGPNNSHWLSLCHVHHRRLHRSLHVQLKLHLRLDASYFCDIVRVHLRHGSPWCSVGSFALCGRWNQAFGFD
jgi:hypothetical protein